VSDINPITVEATILDVEFNPASGWYAVNTDQGKFSTKIAELAQQALDAKGYRGIVQGGEKVTTKPAPDGSGMRTYRDRYFNAFTPTAAGPGNGGYTLPQQQAPPPPAATGFAQTPAGVPTPAPTPAAPAAAGFSPPTAQERSKTNREDAWRMALTSGSERAVQTLPLLAKEQQTFDNQKAIALAWAKWIFFTPVPVEIAGTQVMPHALPQEDLAAAGVGYESPPAPSDDDIPF
jgi:hypothetical protein